METTRAIAKLGPVVVDMVRDNTKEIRNHAQFVSKDEAERLRFLADSMESSLEVAKKAMETHNVIKGLLSQRKTAMDVNMKRQLELIQQNQESILKYNAKTLLDSSSHYQQQYMPGSVQYQYSAFIDTPGTGSKEEEKEQMSDRMTKKNDNNRGYTSNNAKRKHKKAMDLVTNSSAYYFGLNPRWNVGEKDDNNKSRDDPINVYYEYGETDSLDLMPSLDLDAQMGPGSAFHFPHTHGSQMGDSDLDVVVLRQDTVEHNKEEQRDEHNRREQPADNISLNNNTLNRNSIIKLTLYVSHFLFAVATVLRYGASAHTTDVSVATSSSSSSSSSSPSPSSSSSPSPSSLDNSNVIHGQDNASL